MHMGAAIDVQLAHDNFEVLEEAAERLKKALREYKGLFDIADSYEEGKRELKLKLGPRPGPWASPRPSWPARCAGPSTAPRPCACSAGATR